MRICCVISLLELTRIELFDTNMQLEQVSSIFKGYTSYWSDITNVQFEQVNLRAMPHMLVMLDVIAM